MELQVRKIQEKDWDLFPQWWNDWKTDPFPRDFLPGAFQIGEDEEHKEGMGGFVVCKGDDPIAAMWLYLTNSKTAIPAVVVSDKYYKDTDRSDALQLLVNFTTDFAKDMGYKYSFAWAKEGKVLKYYEAAGWYKDESPSFELIKRY